MSVQEWLVRGVPPANLRMYATEGAEFYVCEAEDMLGVRAVWRAKTFSDLLFAVGRGVVELDSGPLAALVLTGEPDAAARVDDLGGGP